MCTYVHMLIRDLHHAHKCPKEIQSREEIVYFVGSFIWSMYKLNASVAHKCPNARREAKLGNFLGHLL